jgi:hypothetical protein
VGVQRLHFRQHQYYQSKAHANKTVAYQGKGKDVLREELKWKSRTHCDGRGIAQIWLQGKADPKALTSSSLLYFAKIPFSLNSSRTSLSFFGESVQKKKHLSVKK